MWGHRFAWLAGFVIVAAAACATWGGGVAVAAGADAGMYPWGGPGCPCAGALHPGPAASAGLVASKLDTLDDTVNAFIANQTAPGAVLLVARRGVIAKWQAYGDAVLYTDAKFDKVAHPMPMAKDTIFDLASVSKLFTAVAVMQLWDEGKLDLDAPVAKYLPRFGVDGKQEVTVRELLTHTSGLRPDPPIPLYQIAGSRAARIDNVLQQPLEYPPGTHYVYSDMNFITLGALIEKLSGEREDQFVRQHITGPLHMTSTLYDPPANLQPRIAATEYQPWTNRGMLQGQVNDENAWALDGVAGHAGVFSDAHDLAIFGQMMLNDGTYDGARILSARAVKLIETNADSRFPLAGCGDPHGPTVPGSCVGNASRVSNEDATGLGWSVDRGYLMGALSGPHTAGHEGFTGTMIAINKPNDIVVVLLTNREHPTRNGPSIVTAIRHVYTGVADAIPVVAPGGGEAWFSGYGGYLNRTLTAKVGAGGGAVSFRTWYRTDPGGDYGVVEASPDDRHWKTLAEFTGSSDGWQGRSYALPAGTQYVRFDYRTDSEINGRGWYVHDVQIDGRAPASWANPDNGWVKRGN